jgi:hypothetical protein
MAHNLDDRQAEVLHLYTELTVCQSILASF